LLLWLPLWLPHPSYLGAFMAQMGYLQPVTGQGAIAGCLLWPGCRDSITALAELFD
jgi:hypothetical protein